MADKSVEKKSEGIQPWQPFADLDRWESDFRDMADLFGRRPWPSGRWPWAMSRSAATSPALDVYEEKDDVVVKAELPGIEKGDVEVELTDNTLTVKGKKKKEEMDPRSGGG